MTPIVRGRRRSGRFRLDAAVRYVRCARSGLPERQAAADEQRRQEHQRLMEQIEAVKAHGRHHARHLGVGNPSASFHSGPRYAIRDGLPIVRPGRRDFE